MGWRAAEVAGLEFVVAFVSYDQVYDPHGSSVKKHLDARWPKYFVVFN